MLNLCQAKDMTLRCDFLRAERERTVTVLQAEQQQSTAQQSHIEHLQSQVGGKLWAGAQCCLAKAVEMLLSGCWLSMCRCRLWRGKMQM